MSTALWVPALPRPMFLRDPRPPRVGDVSNLGRDALTAAGIIGPDARITVTRQSAHDVGFREVFVSVDGEQIAMLRHGESITTEVTAGAHRVRAHNTLFWKTHDIVLKPGEHARFSAVNRAGFGTFSVLIMLGATPVYLSFDRVTTPQPVRASEP